MAHNTYIQGPYTVAGDAGENIFGGDIDLDILDPNGFPVATIPYEPILHDWDEKYPEMGHWADGAADGRTQCTRDVQQVEATARLFAAAPDLLDFAEWIARPANHLSDDEVREKYNSLDAENVLRARAVIAKARGTDR